jgi:hypothetical protein
VVKVADGTADNWT